MGDLGASSTADSSTLSCTKGVGEVLQVRTKAQEHDIYNIKQYDLNLQTLNPMYHFGKNSHFHDNHDCSTCLLYNS